MFLSECIRYTSNTINNQIISLINKCSKFINNATITKCFDKNYMYHKCCEITNQACYCIQNNIFYINTVDNFKYYLIIFFMAIVIIFFYCACKIICKNNQILNNTNITYNNSLPHYNEIDNDIETEDIKNKQITIVELPPPKYNEIDYK
jgi:hypothetical protein